MRPSENRLRAECPRHGGPGILPGALRFHDKRCRLTSIGFLAACLYAGQAGGVEQKSDGLHGYIGYNLSQPAAAADPTGNTTTARANDHLSPDEFSNPPTHARPGCFWDWLNGAMTPEQITRDLEAMKQGGMRGGEIWDVAAMADPDKQVPAGPEFLGPESTRLIAHAIREADRLDMEIGIVASSGWNAGGSWVSPEYAGKALYQSATTVSGPIHFQAKLPLPKLPKFCPQDKAGQPLYLREVAVLAVPGKDKKNIGSPAEVVDLTKNITADGALNWDVPVGDWTILRFVCTNHGQQLVVPSPKSGGPMIDFFDPSATEFHLNYILTTILKELGKPTFAGTSFKTLEFDSMELHGFTPWTETMANEFQRRAGYPVLSYLPLLVGWKMTEPGVQERFLYDWKKVVSDRLIESHYVTAREFLKKFGVSLIAESGGPGPPIWNSNPVDAIKALGAADIPRGEFWNRHRGIFLVKSISSAAHVYDKRLVDAEAFTTWRRWVDGPLNHKDLADRALCEGLNCFSLHSFASSPPEAGLPGRAYHAGTDINPSATWWPMVRGLMDYLTRCSHMLRQGWFVADVCYYYGEQAPNFYPSLIGAPEKPLLAGLHAGYDYDVCSAEVILERMRVENGRITLPDGMSYATLVLPEQDHIPLAVMKKIRELIAAGATVIGNQRPTRAPGLHDGDSLSQSVEKISAELWGAQTKVDSKTVSIIPLDKGRLVVTADRSQALREIGVTEDFGIAGNKPGDLGPLDFVHRKTTEDEFYFVRNKTRQSQSLTCRFRVAAKINGQVPELWWPHSGRRTSCPDWKSIEDGTTEVPLELAPLGSVFVVFRKSNKAWDTIPDPLVIETFAAAKTPAPLTLDGPWQVEFPEGWGAPAKTTFPKLESWTDSKDEGIRLFSGIATYQKTFDAPGSLTKQSRIFLELGDLAEIADVSLNGKPLGIVWLPPYRVEVTGVIQAGTNELKVRIANLWANRFNGDSLLPQSKRFTRSNLDRMQTDPTSDSSYSNRPRGGGRPVYKKIPPLMKSGLLGPVRIITPALREP